MSVSIIDYGMGNIGSILNMLKKICAKSIASSNPDEINRADKIILPCVGAFDNAVKNLKDFIRFFFFSKTDFKWP